MAILGAFSMIGFVICIVMTIVSAIRKNGKVKKWGIGIIACFVLFIIAIVNTPTTQSNTTVNTNNNTEKPSVTTTTNNTTTEKPKEEEPKKDAGIKEGMYKIGTDLQPGEYVVIADGMAYFELAKDSSGSFDSIICNDNFSTRTIVTVNSGEYFTVKNGKIYPVNEAPKVEPDGDILQEGMYKVGIDLKAGEYKITADSMGYAEVAKSSRHILDNIVSNDNFEGEKYVTVKNGQYLTLKNATLKLK